MQIWVSVSVVDGLCFQSSEDPEETPVRCGAALSISFGNGDSDSSSSAEDEGGWKLWKKPEWMKKKN